MIDYGYCQSEIAVGDTFINEADIRKVLSGIKAIGGSWVRFAGAWDLINPPSAPTTYNWVELDRAMRLCAEYGLKPLLCVCLGYGKGGDGSATSYANTCREIVSRYGPSGEGVFKGLLNAVEIFNEENSSINFQPNSPAEYTKFLNAAHAAIKSVHSSCQVIIGGTIATGDVPFAFLPVLTPPFFVIGSAVGAFNWIKGIYDAGGKFDAVGMHYYWPGPSAPTAPDDWMWKFIVDVRALMVAKGDAAKKIWITETGVGFPGPVTPTACRDLLKAMFEACQANYFGPTFIYSYRDANPNPGDINGIFGMVDYNFKPKSPVYEYAQTISAATPGVPGGGTGDTTPPTKPHTPVSSDVTTVTTKLLWDANPADDGVTNYRVYTDANLKVVDTTDVFVTVTGLQPATNPKFYITAFDAAGNESEPSDLVPVTTQPSSGLQSFFDFLFTGTGSTLPTVFSQYGLGFSVLAGIANHNPATTDGRYFTVAPFGSELQSPDHSARISLADRAAGSDRAGMAVVRCSADGLTWVAALSCGGQNNDARPNADSLKIITCIGGTIRVRNAKSAPTATLTQDVELVAEGNAYTARLIDVIGANVLAEVSWTDSANLFPGAGYRRAGMGWQHLRVGGVNYPAPGIVGVKAADRFAVKSASGADLWALGITDDNQWDQILATGLWESAL